MIKGISFENQILSAPLFRAILAGYGDGILSGCGISFSGRTVTIEPGYMIACGGAFCLTSNEQIMISANSGYARIKAKIDKTAASTESEFRQVSFVVDAAETVTGLQPMTQQDINSTGMVYEMEVAVVTCSDSGITSIFRKAGNPRARLTTDMYGDTLPAPGQPGRIFFKKV